MRVLHVASIVGRGGVGRFIFELVNGIDEPGVQQDVLSVCRPVYYEMPCNRFGPLVDGRGFKASLVGARRLWAFLRENPYDVVHIHTNNSSGFAYAEAAKRAGVKHRIVHSHNTSLGKGSSRAKYVIDAALKRIWHSIPTVRLACSKGAGAFLFGNDDFTVVNNGIDTARFTFDPDVRRSLREDLGLFDATVLGFCGNLAPEKNVRKCLGVLAALSEMDSYAKLLIVGTGEEEASLRSEAEALSITDKVVWAGTVADPERYYCAMDCLLMPSFFEGFPLSMVEAQASGLPVLASDRITPEAALTNAVRALDIEASDEKWAEAAASAIAGTSLQNRGRAAQTIADAGFDKQSTVDAVRFVYLRLAEDCRIDASTKA